MHWSQFTDASSGFFHAPESCAPQVLFRPPRWILRPFFIRLATWGTLLEELVLGILIWIYEFRPYVVLTGIVMHLVFEAVMNLQLFGWTMIAGLLLFSDPAMVETWLKP